MAVKQKAKRKEKKKARADPAKAPTTEPIDITPAHADINPPSPVGVPLPHPEERISSDETFTLPPEQRSQHCRATKNCVRGHHFYRRGHLPDTTNNCPRPPPSPVSRRSSGEPHTLQREHQQPPTTADAVHTPRVTPLRQRHESPLHCSRRAEGSNTHFQPHTNTPPSRVSHNNTQNGRSPPLTSLHAASTRLATAQTAALIPATDHSRSSSHHRRSGQPSRPGQRYRSQRARHTSPSSRHHGKHRSRSSHRRRKRPDDKTEEQLKLLDIGLTLTIDQAISKARTCETSKLLAEQLTTEGIKPKSTYKKTEVRQSPQQQQPQQQKRMHQTSQPEPLVTSLASKFAPQAIIAQPETRRAGNSTLLDTSEPSVTPKPKWQPSMSIKCPPPKTTASQFQSRPEENQPQRYAHYQTLDQPLTPSHRLSTTANSRRTTRRRHTHRDETDNHIKSLGSFEAQVPEKPTTDRPDLFSQPSTSWKT
ncbi:hypothetical protein DAPPUDRAFT_112194 [Daphnia pulex]|uniref:Uncharacterized protein n=1 Tax=Daphnia pulex TaxID=6669 RepID=E9HB93_DAPPU|nr:hypothetical protein DAPPUDRAFT_112194 [Daphnia pulex]|eukprot:EFX70989.1 hypothetical protein DAPPUDRAFT_112194 [Daphnia pulex]